MRDDPNGCRPQVCGKLAELGWIGLVIPERYGGAGLSFIDLVVLLEEMGRACLTGSFFSAAVLCTLPILAAGGEELKEEFLPKIARGDMIGRSALYFNHLCSAFC